MPPSHLTEDEKNDIIELIKQGRPLPKEFIYKLCADDEDVFLFWNGRSETVTKAALPFHSIEHIDEPRREPGQPGESLDMFDKGGRQLKGWTNKLIWGDNRLVLSSLVNGPLRDEIERQGGLKLIYIDPPFAVGADFSYNIAVNGEDVTKQQSVIEEIAYRDTWGRGISSYLSMMYERLKLMHQLLAEDGSIYVHCDWRINSYLRVILDDIFGKGGNSEIPGYRSEIIWFHNVIGTGTSVYPKSHESILWYSKSNKWQINSEDERVRVPYSNRITETLKKDEKGWYYVRGNRDSSGNVTGKWFKTYIDPEEIKKGKFIADVWESPKSYREQGKSSTGYKTQKPDLLLEMY